MNLLRIFVRRPVLTTMMLAVFLVLGVRAYQFLIVELFPRIDFPVVVISTVYPGAAPGEVESQVTKKMEDQCSTIADVEELRSYSRESLSQVVVQFELETDVDLDAIEVKDKVDQIRSELPDDAELPVIAKFDFSAVPVMDLVVSAPQTPETIYRLADQVIRERLTRVSGVADVAIVGQREREIHVEVAPERLRAHGLGLLDVVATVAAQNRNVPAGHITRGAGETTLRLLGEVASPAEIADFPLTLPGGGAIPLSEVAEIRDTTAEVRDESAWNGQPVVTLSVQKRSDANTVAVARDVRAAVAELAAALPPGWRVEVARDNSSFVRDAVNDVMSNIGLGILLTALLLLLFLHDWRQTMIAAVSMPASIVCTFLLIQGAGFSLNVISLMALGISVGVLVTNSIVVLENISRHAQGGMDPVEAAERGSAEVAVAVIASTLTNVVVFTPIAFMSGIIGRLFLQFGLTVVFATLFSLVISFTMVPMLAARLLRPGRGVGHGPGAVARAARAWDAGYARFEAAYRRLLARALARRGRVLAGTTVLLIGAMLLFGLIGGEFIPLIDEGVVSVGIELPPGTSLQRTREVADRVAAIARTEREVRDVLVKVGGESRGVEDAQVVMLLVDADERDRGVLEFMNDLRPRLAFLPDARIVVAPQGEGGHEEADLTLEVLGPDRATLAPVAADVLAVVRGIPGLVEVRSSDEPGKPEITVRPLRRQLAARGTAPAALGAELRAGFEGERAGVYREAGEEYDVVVKYASRDRGDPGALPDVPVATSAGPVPLDDVARLERRPGDAEILRLDKQRLVEITANIAQGNLSEKRKLIDAQLDDLDVPAGCTVRYGGEAKYQDESFRSLFEAMFLAVVLTYIVLAAILESFIHPLTIMFTLPLGLIGASAGLFVTGQTVNIFSLMALVMLIGIVVNNAILQLDYAAQLRREGRPPREALTEACVSRLRPIMMANLAIAVGMLPQALGGAGAEFRTAMAVVSIGGVLGSTVFTLFVIPVVYTLMDRFTTEGRRQRQVRA